MNKKTLVFPLLLCLLITIIPTTVSTFGVTSAASSSTGWTLVADARAMKAYPDLKESIWQKNATMPPNGQYDIIGLHRLVKTGTTPKGVVFICPRVAWSGEAWISNPLTDSFTKTENNSQPIYWANRGFDVYAIDYRTHFVPNTLNNSQRAFMQNWTYTLWISDIKEAVDKTKEVSGASKVFMVGPSNGGGLSVMYATKYGQDDLRGIILLDALIYNGRAEVVAKNTTGTNTYNLTKTVNDMISAGTWSTPSFTVQQLNRARYALANPGAPAEDPPGTPLTPTINPLTNKTWTNITEWFAYTMQTAGAGNAYDGYSNVTEYLIHTLAAEPYFSARISLESLAMADWTNCPYVPYDYDDHFNEINIPLLAFASGPLYSNKSGTFRFINGISNTDFTGVMLQKYGHTDVYMGTYSARDVSQPTLDWMVNHLVQTNPYTDPTAVAWDVDASFSFMDMIKANHTYVPADKVANPVQKLTISYDEKPLTCEIKVGGVTYSLGKDFTYTGHVDYIYYNPSFTSPTLGYYYPSSFSGTETTVNYMYNFSGVPGGLEGSLSMLATMKDAVGSIVSVRGTGDFKNVEVKATVSPQWYDAARMVVNIYHDGMVSGWPNAVPTFYTTNTIVTYDQLTDYCVNVWGLSSNPYPAFPANVRSEYRIFNVVIGDKFYLGVSCSSGTSSVYNPVAKTVALTYNATWYLGDWYRGVAKMDQGFKGAMIVTLLNYNLANATATPPTPATYDLGPAVWNLQGFGALTGQNMMLRADGPVQPYMAKGYDILP
jgi:pimeloyl-ACP methyl ester carboxylesterase